MYTLFLTREKRCLSAKICCVLPKKCRRFYCDLKLNRISLKVHEIVLAWVCLGSRIDANNLLRRLLLQFGRSYRVRARSAPNSRGGQRLKFAKLKFRLHLFF